MCGYQPKDEDMNYGLFYRKEEFDIGDGNEIFADTVGVFLRVVPDFK